MRPCKRCEKPFEPIPEMEAKLQARGSFQKVCASCALEAIDEMCVESVLHMTDEEIEAELREDGVDVKAYAERVRSLINEVMAKRDER